MMMKHVAAAVSYIHESQVLMKPKFKAVGAISLVNKTLSLYLVDTPLESGFRVNSESGELQIQDATPELLVRRTIEAVDCLYRTWKNMLAHEKKSCARRGTAGSPAWN